MSRVQRICIYCKKQPAAGSRKGCHDCKVYQTKQHALLYQERKSNGLCPLCGRTAEAGHVRCVECRTDEINSRAKRREKRKTEGLCRLCKDPKLEHNSLCYLCWLKEMSRRSTGTTEHAQALQAILERQNYKCALTGKVLTPGLDASVDHILPKHRGGGNEVSNLRWLLFQVNRMRSSLLDDELIELCEVILTHHGLSAKNGG